MIRRSTCNHTLHLLLSVLSLGLWLPIWGLSMIQIGGWRCVYCGRRTSRSFLR